MLRVSREAVQVVSIRAQWLSIASAFTLTATIVTVTFIIIATTGAEWRELTSDSNALGRDPWYFGFMEVASSLVMAAAAGVALFTSTISSGEARRFALWAGAFTTLLSLDDIYMLHETISERSLYAIYGGFVLGLFAFNRNYVSRTPLFLALISVSCLAAAVITDTANDWDIVQLKEVEEILELGPFCLWSAYLVSCCRQALAPLRRDNNSPVAQDRM